MATRTDFIFGGRPEAGRAGQSPSRQLQQQQPSSSSSSSTPSAAVSSMTQPSYLAAALPPHSGAASAAAGHWSVPPGTSHGARTGGGGPVNVASIRGTVSDQLLSFGRGLQRTRHAIIQAAAKRDRELRQAHSMQTRLKRANAILTAELIAVKEQLAQCKADKDVRVCCVGVVPGSRGRGSSSGSGSGQWQLQWPMLVAGNPVPTLLCLGTVAVLAPPWPVACDHWQFPATVRRRPGDQEART